MRTSKNNQSDKKRLVAGHRRMLLKTALLATAIGGLFAGTVQAQDVKFPTKTVTIVVPYTPGGASDVQARLIGQRLNQLWGQPVIVENKPGASASIGMQYVARSAPDGHTLVISDLGTLTIGPSLRKLPYDLEKDFATIATLSYSPYLLTAHPSAPYNTMKELIEYSKKNPTKVNYGTSGLGTNPHLAGKLFASHLGLQWTDIPSKGGSQTIQDVISGQVELQFNSVFSTAAFVKQGKLKALGVSSEKRLPDMPNLPTVNEVIPSFVAGGYQGIFAPAATPTAIVSKINADIVKVLAMPEVKDKLAGLGADTVGNSPDAMRKFLREDKDRWAKLIKELNLKLEE
jgi:tripartite-type tricarboxylate transporter receptor subunit TctC